MIGSDAAFSLPCWGSSIAIVTLPLDESPAGLAELGVRPVPPLLAGVDAAGVALHADKTSSDAPASALSFRNFMHIPPRSLSSRVAPVDLGRRGPPDDPAAPRGRPASDAALPPSVDQGRSTEGGSERRYVTDDGAGRWLGRRAGCRRSDAVS